MNMERELDGLIAQSAKANGVEPDVLLALLELDQTFSSFAVYGSRAEFARRVAHILDAAADQSST
ncbi:hypothetical protein WT77_18915 [Burkholderia stagnalis]|uniref:hypothetical protein n=1 Tax=Burkholderia stagnalis TaxID=1503054 RepID=UPI00075F7B91|nr:hypothetical protein [Burkholderia stagnalis]KWK21996.1 hypothetical protein WT77_18915 [Burkholderia stagnalis]